MIYWHLAYLGYGLTSGLRSQGEDLVREVADHAKASYERERADHSHAFCTSASGPVPTTVPSGGLVEVLRADWDGDDDTGWRCLRLEIHGGVYCQMNYMAAADSFEVTAKCKYDPRTYGFVSYRIRGRAVDGKVQVGEVETINER
jgi:hypothetical protein